MSRPDYRTGWVYILSNPAMPGLLKIGCTERTPDDRARELSDKTGVPARFVVEWAWPVSDWKAVEALTHTRLGACRPNVNREFFSCSVSKARRAIKHAARAYLRPAWLRLLIGPRRRRMASRPLFKKSRPVRDSLLRPAIVAMATVGLLAWLKPAAPLWLPGSVRATVALVERL